MTVKEAYDRGLIREGINIQTNGSTDTIYSSRLQGRITKVDIVNRDFIFRSTKLGNWYVNTDNDEATIEFLDSEVRVFKVTKFIVDGIIEGSDYKNNKEYIKLNKQHHIKIGDTIEAKVIHNGRLYIVLNLKEIR